MNKTRCYYISWSLGTFNKVTSSSNASWPSMCKDLHGPIESTPDKGCRVLSSGGLTPVSLRAEFHEALNLIGI